MKKFVFLITTAIFLFATTKSAQADENEDVIGTEDIIALTMDALPQCLEWEVVGMCFWLKCGFGCSVNTSLKVKNFVPDLVVQAYNRNTGEPWDYAQQAIELVGMDEDSSWLKSLLNTAGGLMGSDADVDDSVDIAAGQRRTATPLHKSSLSFYMVDAFGNPAIIPFNALSESFNGNFCESEADEFFMYYNSNMDLAAWRWNIPEIYYPRSWIPFMDILGGNKNNWGYIFPRTGFSVKQDSLKAAVISTYRAMHMVTGNDNEHLILKTLETKSSSGYWPEPSLDWENKDTGLFQMLYPVEDDSCHSFPYDGDSDNNDRRSDDLNYVWSFWKAYKCCSKEGQSLIFHFG